MGKQVWGVTKVLDALLIGRFFLLEDVENFRTPP